MSSGLVCDLPDAVDPEQIMEIDPTARSVYDLIEVSRHGGRISHLSNRDKSAYRLRASASFTGIPRCASITTMTWNSGRRWCQLNNDKHEPHHYGCHWISATNLERWHRVELRLPLDHVTPGETNLPALRWSDQWRIVGHAARCYDHRATRQPVITRASTAGRGPTRAQQDRFG
jgi:hypothetical protein